MIDLIAEQESRELESVRLGAEAYMRLVNESEEGSMTPGKALVKKNLQAVKLAVEDFMQACADGRAGGKHAAYPYLLHVEPAQAAYLALRMSVSAAAEGAKLNTAAVNLAMLVEDHINYERLAGTNPGLYRTTIKHLMRYRDGRRRREVMARQAKKYAFENLAWSASERLLLGSKLIELVEASTGIVRAVRHTEGHHNTPYRLEFAPEVAEYLKEAHSFLSMLAPRHLPMLVKPRPWASPTDGGYLTRAVRAWLVNVSNKDMLSAYEDIDMPDVYAAVNRVQETAWRINRAIYGVLMEVFTTGGRLGGLPPQEDEPLPAKPTWLAEGLTEEQMQPEQVEEFKQWKIDAAKRHAENGANRSRRVAVGMALHAAQQMVTFDRMYFPHYIDFRGRIYPFCSDLSPQGNDFSKALGEFAEGKPLGEDGAYWLAVHLANNYGAGGVDKLPFDERVAWVEAHEREILDSAMNPLDGERFWTQADNPWQFLAACFEWAGYCVQGNEYVSHLPVGMDGSCSGLQHYSALLRDPVGGAAVNLVPGSKPADVYSQVAVAAQAVVDASEDVRLAMWKGGKVTRKIVKRPTMTMCYSATHKGMQEQIADELRKLDDGDAGAYLMLSENTSNYHPSLALAGVVWEAISGVVVAAREGMDFLKKCARVAASADLPAQWTAPNGLRVTQPYVEEIGERVRVHYMGESIRLTVVSDGKKVSAGEQALGIAPNYVHSLDGSHMMATVLLGAENGLDTWCMVHDSFGAHACDIGKLNAVLRETFVQQYSENLLQRYRDELVAQLEATGHADKVKEVPEVPPMGALDLDAVRQSDYFFA